MEESATVTAEPGEQLDATAPDEDLIDDVLVEEVSIDGMCGVY